MALSRQVGNRRGDFVQHRDLLGAGEQTAHAGAPRSFQGASDLRLEDHDDAAQHQPRQRVADDEVDHAQLQDAA